jgi:hypothetical protein
LETSGGQNCNPNFYLFILTTQLHIRYLWWLRVVIFSSIDVNMNNSIVGRQMLWLNLTKLVDKIYSFKLCQMLHKNMIKKYSSLDCQIFRTLSTSFHWFQFEWGVILGVNKSLTPQVEFHKNSYQLLATFLKAGVPYLCSDESVLDETYFS